MRRRAKIGLNKGEAHHALKRVINFHHRGELRDRTEEGQHYRVAGLNLLAAIIIYLEHAEARRGRLHQEERRPSTSRRTGTDPEGNAPMACQRLAVGALVASHWLARSVHLLDPRRPVFPRSHIVASAIFRLDNRGRPHRRRDLRRCRQPGSGSLYQWLAIGTRVACRRSATGTWAASQMASRKVGSPLNVWWGGGRLHALWPATRVILLTTSEASASEASRQGAFLAKARVTRSLGSHWLATGTFLASQWPARMGF